MSKVLISYFSASGVTRDVAKKIAEVVRGDVFEIEPVDKYTEEDLDWTNKQSRSSIEMADSNSRPKIVKKVDNIEAYDKVILGFPVWWYKEPTIVDTFIEENDLRNKDIYVFVTSGGSGVEGSLSSIKEKYSYLNIISGKRVTNPSNEEIIEWLL